jgi:hypothetical protein
MTLSVIPAKAGTQELRTPRSWVPASAGMTGLRRIFLRGDAHKCGR